MIQYRQGNVLLADAPILAHGCNTIGKMNAGIARHIRLKYHEMFDDYVQRCRSQEFHMGAAYLFRTGDGRGVINIGTQGGDGAELWAIDRGFRAMRELCEREDIGHVAMPRIGTGLGRLEWKEVEPVLVRAFKGAEVLVDVYVLTNARPRRSVPRTE